MESIRSVISSLSRFLTADLAFPPLCFNENPNFSTDRDKEPQSIEYY
jgi:hypothetical protein